MRTMKRWLALMMCIAMLVSGFALAETEVAPVQGQETIQDEADPEAGGGILK